MSISAVEIAFQSNSEEFKFQRNLTFEYRKIPQRRRYRVLILDVYLVRPNIRTFLTNGKL